MSKDEQTENLLSIPTLDTSIENSLSTPYFSVGDWPEENWWEVFRSDELNSLIAKSLVDNPDLQGIRRRIDFAAQNAKIERSRLFPLIYFNFEEEWQLLSHHGLYRAFNEKIPINANLVDLTLSFNYEFDFWGKNLNLYRAALGVTKAQEAETAQVQLITTTAVAQAYFTLKTNLVRQHLYERLYEVRSKIYDLQNLLQDSALASILPPLLSSENLLESQKLLTKIKEEVETDRHLINILIGNGPDESLDIDDHFPPIPETLVLPSRLTLNLLARRPDLMAQIWRVEALAHEVGAAKADFYPNINLGAFVGLESVLYKFLFNTHSKVAGLSPAVHLPIFTAGAIRANVRAKKASFDQAVYDYNNLILQSTQEVADLLVLARSIFDQKKDQDGIVKNAKERFDVTLLRCEKGLDNFLTAYAFEEELIEKELDDITLLYSQYVAAIKLIKALGGGYQSEYIPLHLKESL